MYFIRSWDRIARPMHFCSFQCTLWCLPGQVEAGGMLCSFCQRRKPNGFAVSAPLRIRKYMLDSCHLSSSNISILGRWYVCGLPGPWWRRTNELLSWSGPDSKGLAFLTFRMWMIPTSLYFMCHLMAWRQVTCLSPGHIAFVLSTTKLDLTKSQLRRRNHRMIRKKWD